MSVSSEQDQFSSCNAETLNKQSPVVFGSPQDFSSAEKGISAEDELTLFLHRVEKDAIYLIEEVLKESDFRLYPDNGGFADPVSAVSETDGGSQRRFG